MALEKRAELASLIQQEFPLWSEEIRARLIRYWELLVAENKVQNLTRLLDPRNFVDDNLIDCAELVKQPWIEYPAMDLGSGGGIPGVICAILGTGPWILVDSEGRKAEFLQAAVSTLGLENVRVFRGRGEDYLKTERVGSVVARAVGPVGRIYAWIRGCSTWNNLVLLKGPAWEAEWTEFQSENRSKGLRVAARCDYSAGVQKKTRVILRLDRVGK